MIPQELKVQTPLLLTVTVLSLALGVTGYWFISHTSESLASLDTDRIVAWLDSNSAIEEADFSRSIAKVALAQHRFAESQQDVIRAFSTGFLVLGALLALGIGMSNRRAA